MTTEPTSWGKGVDPVSVLGEQNLKEAMGQEEPEGQGLYPELEEFITSMSGPPEASQVPFEWTQLHYDVFNVMSAADKQRLEQLATRLAKGQDCIMCKEDTFFTKEGQYLVVLKWAEYDAKGNKDAGSTSGSSRLVSQPDS